MTVTIQPNRARGAVAAPPSKSFAHRYLLATALAEGGGRVKGISQSEDMSATLACAESLGAVYEREGDAVRFLGRGGKRDSIFPCHESGSTLRFFIPIALSQTECATFLGTPRLIARGISVYEELFATKGITVERGEDRLTVKGKLTAGEFHLRGDVSSQFITGLLYALPLLEGDSLLCVSSPVESRSYIDITLAVLKDFGIVIEEREPNVFFIAGGQRYAVRESVVEGDWSNGAFLLALNALGGEVALSGLLPDSKQGDRVFPTLLARLEEPSPEIDLTDCPDLAPLLFAMAARGHGAHFTGTARLKIKESDRVEAMRTELEKVGARTEGTENTFTVLPSSLHPPKEVIEGHNDHRIVMAMAVLLTELGGSIFGAEAVKKSFPDFFAVLRKLQIEVSYDA